MKVYDKNNPFYKIVKKIIEVPIILENEDFVVINDLYPISEIHVLIISKKEYISYDDFSNNASDNEILSLNKIINQVTKKLNVDKSGYRIFTNHMSSAGQSVFHFHVHIIAGKNIPTLSK